MTDPIADPLQAAPAGSPPPPAIEAGPTEATGTGPTETILILDTSPPADPPPPYPSRERRSRTGRQGRRRRAHAVDGTSGHLQAPSSSTDAGEDCGDTNASHPFTDSDEDHAEVGETTPLLGESSPRIPHRGPGLMTRQRTLSISSTLRSSTSIAPSFAQTLLSAFHPDRDSDLDPDCEIHYRDARNRAGDTTGTPTHQFDVEQTQDSGPEDSPDSPTARFFARQRKPCTDRWKKYFRPVTIRAYYSSLFHLLVLNFPYALAAWIYLFVFTLTGTTTLMALPLGAILCFLDLLGARTFARGELYLQSTFHGPLAFPPPYPPHPIFTRVRPPTPPEIEAGAGVTYEHSFYRNAYAMFTDSTSYQALFYFLVIKPGITLLLSIFLVVLVPISFVLVLPFPAILRLARRLGIWQANIAVEGLYYAVR
ncbi:hypothetical protein K474DRAFT_1645540 [Panus rudis PR-1116 ss-1]|nr:hypothetical protein K474DRAFT_1645540 [Panus rudis PR-1116 ss-1]